MKDLWKKTGVVVVGMTLAGAVMAAGTGSEAMEQSADIVKQGLNLALTALAAVLFLAGVAAIVAKVWSAASGKGTWGEVFIPVVVVAVVVVFAGWLVDQGQTATDAITAAGT